jgi:hypothetical protein
MPLMLLRFWREGVMVALVLALGLALLAKAGESRRADKWQARARAEIAAHKLTIAHVRAAAEKARADDAAHARRVERDQSKVSEEVSRDYQKDLADLRRRYDALRVRLGKTQANPGGTGSAPLPCLPGAAGGPDGAACQEGLPSEDALIASEIALRLEALQRWVTGQLGVERDKPHPKPDQ